MRIDSDTSLQNSGLQNSQLQGSGAQALPESARAGNDASVKLNSSGAAAGSSAVGADQAQLSGFHLQVQALVAQAAQLPDPGPDKVSALRQAFARGTYQLDPQKVAGALFENLAVNRAA
jgi:flagellar biosynthesis anti-sigma factor FlgM